MIKNHAITVLQELKVRFISKLFLQTLERSTVKCLKRKTPITAQTYLATYQSELEENPKARETLMNKTHLVMALLLISGKRDFQPIISCSITKPKECFTLPHEVFFVIYFNSGKGRLDLQGHG